MEILFQILIFLIINLSLKIEAFNCNNILIRARLCKFSYTNDLSKIINKCNYNNYTQINNCFIFHDKTTLDLCFRGTANINDIFFNINIYPETYFKKNIKIHRGFLKKYLSIRELILNKTNEIINNNNIQEIYMSGHSSGGAIANIASLDFVDIYPDIKINSITFGSPKLANKAFTEEYNKKIKNSIRIVNKNDIIQYLPLPILYHHIHMPIILNNNKNYKLFTNIYNFFLENHRTNSYISNLKKICFLESSSREIKDI